MKTLSTIAKRSGPIVLCALLGPLGALSGCATSTRTSDLSTDGVAARVATRDLPTRRRCAGEATERCYAGSSDRVALLGCLQESIGACEAAVPATLWASRSTAR